MKMKIKLVIKLIKKRLMNLILEIKIVKMIYYKKELMK